MFDGNLGAGAPENRRKIGNCANLRLLVPSGVGNDGIRIGKFLGEDHLESLGDSQMPEPFADDVGKRAVE